MKPEDPKVVNPRYVGATLDEVARTVFRASRRQSAKATRSSDRRARDIDKRRNNKG